MKRQRIFGSLGRGIVGAILASGLLFCSGCRQTNTIVVSPSPAASTPQAEGDAEPFSELAKRFQVAADDTQPGYRLLEPILRQSAPVLDLSTVDLDTPEEQYRFDAEVLAVFKKSLDAEYFLPPKPLMAGDAGVDFRGLRLLISLTAQRADQKWQKGEYEKALEVAQIPLELSAKMRSLPETASVNLFSSNYADAVLSLIPHWLETANLKVDTIDSLAALLWTFAPDYNMVRETVSVDFAQVYFSLQSPEGRELLGIGEVQDSTLQAWIDDLLSIHQQASLLYDLNAFEPASFNQKVIGAAGPIQGLVIDYPEVATMQKHAFAKYSATQLGLALLGSEAEENRALSSHELVNKIFSERPDNAKAINSLLTVKSTPNSISIVGSKEQFELIAPGSEPILFEHHTEPTF